MSQNKTVIQGLEPADENGFNQSVSQNLYSRGARGGARGTVVPGMTDNVAASQEAPQRQAAAPQHQVASSGKPIVGFLYSVSRTPAGEFWPLHIGQNTIGQNPESDIVLSEGTVSSDHAVLVVRKMKNPEKVIASISDARSTNGTMINGVSLGFSAAECKNGDIITVGDNYELFLVLIDAPTLGLKVSEDFIPVDTEERVDNGPVMEAGFTRPGEGYQPFSGENTPPPFGGYTPAGGTIGLDGTSTGNKGGTIGM